MDCTGCGHQNREGAKFCAQCATPLPVACASCGAELATTARFCDQCGTAVAATASVADNATRKVVTVLFGDLVGSTSFGERVDVESARDAMAEYHAMARQAIEAAGGTVAKFIGDGVMALFGVPDVAEDDAERAVAAGLALQQGFAPISERVAQRHGAELGLRVGINTGEIVLAAGDADLIGDAINTAARIESSCPPGEVVVGEETWRLTRTRIGYETLGEVDVKGKDEPVPTYRVADTEDVDDQQATPFVGRVDELSRLRSVYDGAVEARNARLASVIGMPGVGKTRIAREFCESLGDDVSVVVLRCERAGTATFAPIADLLRTVTAIGEQSEPADVVSALRELVADLDDADRVADLLASFVGAAPARSTEEAFLAVRRLVEAFGRRQPLVIVLDDIQWAEPLFLDLLEHLAEWVHDAPAMLIGLARPELRELRPELAEESRWLPAVLALEGLDAEATAELAARLIGADSLPAELIGRLPASTEGNPLFVRELMRMLVDDRVLEQTSAGWQLTIEADAVEVPSTIQSLLAARLDRMSGDERNLIELASVVGPEFALGAVATIAEREAGELRGALDRLRRRELVEPTGNYWGDEPIYRFHHVLIRDAAYRRILKRRRADLHLSVGEWTEQTAANLAGEHEVAIAYHYEQAHDYRQQLDDVDEVAAMAGQRAAELFGVAAERALERDDLAAAGTLAERSLARLASEDPGVAAMLVVACEAVLSLGDVARSRPILERLHQVADGDQRQSAWADCFAAQLTVLTDPEHLHDAEQSVNEAAARLETLGDVAGVAKARHVRAGALARLGQVGACEAELDLALTAARSAGDRRRVAAVLGAAPVAALWGPSPIPRAGGRCLDVIRLLRITTGSPAVEATSVRCQAVLEALRGRFDTARSMLADARSTVEELGLRHGVGETDLYTGIVELLAGEPAVAEPPLRAAYEGLGQLGIGADAGQAAAYLARAVLQQGRLDEADELAASSAALAGENLQTAIAARTVQAEILAERGQLPEAIVKAEGAVALAIGTDIVVDHANANAVLARVRRLAGDETGAGVAAAAAAALYEQKAATVAVERSAIEPTPESRAVSAVPVAGGSPPDPELDDLTGGGASLPTDHVPWNAADRLSRRGLVTFLDPASAGWEETLHPDHVSEDRRPIVAYRTEGSDETIEMWRGGGTAADYTLNIETIATRGEHLVLYRFTYVGAHREFDFLHLDRWTDDELHDLLVRFDVSQLAEAVAELERLYLEELGDEDREPAESAELSNAASRALSADPSSGMVVEVIAAYDDAYCLCRVETNDPDRRENLVVGVLGADGRTIDTQLFGADQEAEARQALLSSWLSSLNERRRAVLALATEFGRAWVSPTTHSFDELLDPAFEAVDGRTLGMGRVDRLGMERALRGRESDGAGRPPVTSRIAFVSDDVMLFRANNTGVAPDSGVRWEEIACNVLVAQDDKLTRLEMFDEHRWHDAVARGAELARLQRITLSNASWRLGYRLFARWNTGQLGTELLADDFVREDRRQLIGMPEASQEAYVEVLQHLFDLGATWFAGDAIAVRGERLALSPAEIRYGDGDTVVEYLTIMALDPDCRVAERAVLFGPDQVAEALDELEACYVASLDSADADTRRVVLAFGDAYRVLDLERLGALLTPDFVWVDHRPASFPPMDRDQFLAAQGVRREVMGKNVLVTTQVHLVSDGVVVSSFGLHGQSPDTTADWTEDLVAVFLVEDVRLRRNETFAPEDVDLALERAAELIAESKRLHVQRRLENAATRHRDQSIAEGWGVEQFAEDYVHDDRRSVVSSGVAGRIEMQAGMEFFRELGSSTTCETLAIRGDRFSLFSVTIERRGFVIGELMVNELTEDGRVRRNVVFDPKDLEAALDELDAMYLASIEPDDAETYRVATQQYSAYVDLDAERLDELTAENHVFVDHRRLANFGELGRAEFFEMFESRRATRGAGRALSTAVHRLEPGVLVYSTAERTTAGSGGAEVTSSGVFVARVADGRADRTEIFDDDQLDQALARAEALIAGDRPL